MSMSACKSLFLQWFRQGHPGFVVHETRTVVHETAHTSRPFEKISALLRPLPWTHHLLSPDRAKRPAERQLAAAGQGLWTGLKNVSPQLAQIHPATAVESKPGRRKR